MAENKKESKLYTVHFHCDDCGKETKFTGETLLSNPPKYVHVCPNCGQTYNLDTPYPKVEFDIR